MSKGKAALAPPSTSHQSSGQPCHACHALTPASSLSRLAGCLCAVYAHIHPRRPHPPQEHLAQSIIPRFTGFGHFQILPPWKENNFSTSLSPTLMQIPPSSFWVKAQQKLIPNKFCPTCPPVTTPLCHLPRLSRNSECVGIFFERKQVELVVAL